MDAAIYVAAAEDAAQIRAELKSRFGWTSRQVSVKAETFSMGSATTRALEFISEAAAPTTTIRSEAGNGKTIGNAAPSC